MTKNIFVPVDGSKNSEDALDKAIELAEACGAKLSFLYVANINQLAINACLTDAILDSVTKAGDVILERAMDKVPAGRPMGKTLLNWIGALKASALIWKPM